MLDKTMV